MRAPREPLDRRARAAYRGNMFQRWSVLWLRAAAALVCAGFVVAQDDADEFSVLLEEANKNLAKGELRSAENGFLEVLEAASEEREEDRPEAAALLAARCGLLSIELRRGNYREVAKGVGDLEEPVRNGREPQELLARALSSQGDYDGALAVWSGLASRDASDLEARYEQGDVLFAMGRRKDARAQWEATVALPEPTTAEGLAQRARCRWRLGGKDQIVAASGELVRSLELTKDHAPARLTLGILRFLAYGEAKDFPSGEADLKKVLDLHGDVEEALLWLYRLRSSNYVLDGGKTEPFLDRALAQNPRCMDALVLRAARILDDRRYKDAREAFDQALLVNPRHKDALAHRAAAAFLLHDEGDYTKWREKALAGDPGQSDVDRILGDHLVALYRFADSIPFYEAAIGADPTDVPALHGLGKALVYTGQGARAKEVLLRAKGLMPGFVDPWRNNALAVQQKLDEQYERVENERFVVSLHKDDRGVMEEYLMPLCLEAFEKLGRKYSHQPDRKVSVEVLHTWDDFSVRTIGFRGFTALGACFGSFLTLVSPGDTDLRRQDFMWQATVWHEYTHVLTLGVSKHRVPRWLTEGFSVHEEKQRDPTWERGMDRELFDAFYNRDIPPVRLLNRLFRGDRILFGYYQGGLIVDLVARDFGFEKAIELLRAFGDDLDTEDAFERALGISSADFDARFLTFVETEKLRGMKLEPRRDDAAVHRLLMRVAKDAADLDARIDLAWAFAQRNNPVDAGPHLAYALQQEPENGRALLVRAALLAARQSTAEALDAWKRGFAAGADDFDSRVAYGRTILAGGDVEGAIAQFEAAKRCWPGCTEQDNAPELLIAAALREQGKKDEALMQLREYCRRTARAYAPRWTLAGFYRDAGDRDEELHWLEQCAQIDPFRREMHVRIGECQELSGRLEQAALEFEVAAAVLPSLDRKYTARGAERPAVEDPGEREERGGLMVRAAKLRDRLGDRARAVQLAKRVADAWPASAAAAEANALLQEWQPR